MSEGSSIDFMVNKSFDYALGRESFVRESVNFIWKNWGRTSEQTKTKILSKLKEALSDYELEVLQNELILTYSNEKVRYKGVLGNYETAGYWKGLYNLVS